MAEENKTVVAQEKTKPAKKKTHGKFVTWLINFPKKIGNAFKNMYYELKKVSWPTKKKLLVYSVVVLVFMVFMSIVIGLLDMGASALIKVLAS